MVTRLAPPTDWNSTRMLPSLARAPSRAGTDPSAREEAHGPSAGVHQPPGIIWWRNHGHRDPSNTVRSSSTRQSPVEATEYYKFPSEVFTS